MPERDDQNEEALKRLDERLDALQAGRSKPAAATVGTGGIGDGYRLLAELIGGVLAGVGFGWLFDRFFHTQPWGIGIGLAVGSGLSVYMAAHSAHRMGQKALARSGYVAPVADDEDDD